VAPPSGRANGKDTVQRFGISAAAIFPGDGGRFFQAALRCHRPAVELGVERRALHDVDHPLPQYGDQEQRLPSAATTIRPPAAIGLLAVEVTRRRPLPNATPSLWHVENSSQV
jgi:hypothetical protein